MCDKAEVADGDLCTQDPRFPPRIITIIVRLRFPLRRGYNYEAFSKNDGQNYNAQNMLCGFSNQPMSEQQ